MTKEEIREAFTARFNDSFAGRSEDIINWIVENFGEPASPPFHKAFTGMLDKHGKSIHEGDSVKLYHKGEYVVCKVIYDVKHAAFFIRWPDGYVNQYFMNGSSYEIVANTNI
jgi:hypothetical protein